MNLIIPICVGIGLAAACGFRVFLPLLAMAIAGHTGWVHPVPGFQWLGSGTSLAILGVASAVEVAGYYIPWVDHALDVVASPAAVAAGTLVVGAVVPIHDPAIKWALAVIAGGGAAGIFQTGTVTARAASGLTTAGLGNPIISTVELVCATVLSILAIVVPVVAAIIVLLLIVVVLRKIITRRRRRRVRCDEPVM